MLLAVTLFYLKFETVRIKVTEMRNQKKVRPDEGKRLSDGHKAEDFSNTAHRQFAIMSVQQKVIH